MKPVIRRAAGAYVVSVPTSTSTASQISEIRIADIAIPRDRLRRLRPEVVDQIAESIQARGRLIHPITVRPLGCARYKLNAGWHRFETARKLGHNPPCGFEAILGDYPGPYGRPLAHVQHIGGFIKRNRADRLDRLSAVVCSIALQHGVPVETIRKALMRDSRGQARTPLGAALDLLSERS